MLKRSNPLKNINENISSVDGHSPLKYVKTLLEDFAKLLNESDCYDMEIKVGVESQDIRIFKAHSAILKSRSLYFQTALSNNWVKRSDDGVILFEKKNISPRVFEIILNYIYIGVVETHVDHLDPNEVLELLEACDELYFHEMIDDLQIHLIEQNRTWMLQNIAYLHKYSSEHQSFKLLQEFYDGLLYTDPELFLESHNMEAIEKSLLVYILKNNLSLDEIEVWDYIIQWGLGQNKELQADVSRWNNNDLVFLMNILEDIIPLIKFSKISSKDFHEKVSPFKNIFKNELYNELLQYYSNEELKLGLLPQKDSRTDNAKLLNLETQRLLSSWIDWKEDIYNEDNLPYNFELIFSGTQDGYSGKHAFQGKCFDIKKTIVLMKLKETGEIIGGYNPACWNIKGKTLSETYCIDDTEQSFIFKIDEEQMGNSILSRLEVKYGIIHWGTPYDFEEDEAILNFKDLQLLRSIEDDQFYCKYRVNYRHDNDLNLTNNFIDFHLLEEFEVYRLVKKNLKICDYLYNSSS